mmetsp:Transcript_30792/g.59353  ORF Transcript_30792/g.59353 Transcript_30792/m.59353 type:complete len:253 (+) Transcript_30792:478-1236(+)
MAVSKSHGVFVAPSTSSDPESCFTPSICASNSVLMRRAASDSPDSPLAPHKESTSSIKMIDGWPSRAISKRLLTRRSLSPIHFDTKSEEDMVKNVAEASVAQAFARCVFPVPGGPYKRIPFHGLRGPWKSWGNLVGRITVSCSASFAAFRPAMSSQLTFGLVVMMAPSSPFLSRCASLSSAAVSAAVSTVGGGAVAVAPPPPVGRALPNGAAGGAGGKAPEEICVLSRSAISTRFSSRSRIISLTFGLFSHL